MSAQHGVVVAVVDDRNDPDGEGRVRVRYKWLPGEPRSTWAPIAAPLAGKERGAWFMPELDDEVLVAFEHGEFDHPFVVGFLWNGKEKPPDTDAKHRVIVTPGGHQLRFEDNDGATKVVLKTAGGHVVTMTDQSGGAKVSVQTSAGHSLVMDDVAQSMTLTTPGQQTVALTDAPPAVRLQGGGRQLSLIGSQVVIA